MGPPWTTSYGCGPRQVSVPFCGPGAPPDAATSLTDHKVHQLLCWALNLMWMEPWCMRLFSHGPVGFSVCVTHLTVGRFLFHCICEVPPSLTTEDALDIPKLSVTRLTRWPEGEHSSFRRGTLLGTDLIQNTC